MLFSGMTIAPAWSLVARATDHSGHLRMAIASMVRSTP
jgi:hypothetical protein